METAANNRELILKTASKLISEKGFDQTSLAEIARHAGISKGTLYYYYASKDDLIFDINEWHMSRITERLLALSARLRAEGQVSISMITQAILDELLNASIRSRLHVYLVHQALTSRRPHLKERFQNSYLTWKTMLREEIEKMGFSESEIGFLPDLLVAIVDGFIIQTLLDVQRPDMVQVADYVGARLNPTTE